MMSVLHGHGVSVWCHAMMSGYAVMPWCHCRLPGHDVTVCYQIMMWPCCHASVSCQGVISVQFVRTWCQCIVWHMPVYYVIVLYHCIMSVYDVRYMLSGLHARLWCYFHVTTPCQYQCMMSEHVSDDSVCCQWIMSLYAVRARCHCILTHLSEHDVTVRLINL